RSVAVVTDVFNDRANKANNSIVGFLRGPLEVIFDHILWRGSCHDSLHLDATCLARRWLSVLCCRGFRIETGLLSPLTLSVALSPLQLEALKIQVPFYVF